MRVAKTRVAPVSASLTVRVSSVLPFLFNRPVAVRRRRKMTSSGAPALRPRRVAQPPPPSVPSREASSLLIGGGVSISQVESASSVIVWRAELVRVAEAHESAEIQERFAQERYAEALGRVVAPLATTVDEP